VVPNHFSTFIDKWIYIRRGCNNWVICLQPRGVNIKTPTFIGYQCRDLGTDVIADLVCS
jgi:hypothetical protein